jgi:C4-dicarboxylate-specific signal transduction histidine kinase
MSQPTFRVLVVEDHPPDRELIELLLANAPSATFQVDHVVLLAEALKRVDQGGMDVVLLDLSLPDSDGIDACIAVHQRDSTVPIVVVTGLDDEDLAIRAVKRGAQDYLVKGHIDSQVLCRSLRYAVERQRAEVDLRRARDELELRVEQRTAELIEANRKLQHQIVEREKAEALAKRRQEELTHVARLNTLGEMASQLAHELNQPLTAIVAYARSCLRRLRSDQWDKAELIDELEKAAGQAKRGGEIIRRLRRLVSRHDSERVTVNINESIEDIAGVLEWESRARGFDIHLALDDRLPDVAVDRVQIEQVLLNLMRNGLEAMEDVEHPVLVVKSGLAADDSNAIEVQVIDQGRGCAPETMEALFEPFFTTKPDGLGLGISISRSILASHSGSLSARRNDDRGLTFFFTLPIRSGPEAQQ